MYSYNPLFCEFVQDSFTIPGFQDRVRELQEETGGRSYSDESGGGKYFTLAIFLVFEDLTSFEYFEYYNYLEYLTI